MWPQEHEMYQYNDLAKDLVAQNKNRIKQLEEKLREFDQQCHFDKLQQRNTPYASFTPTTNSIPSPIPPRSQWLTRSTEHNSPSTSNGFRSSEISVDPIPVWPVGHSNQRKSQNTPKLEKTSFETPPQPHHSQARIAWAGESRNSSVPVPPPYPQKTSQNDVDEFGFHSRPTVRRLPPPEVDEFGFRRVPEPIARKIEEEKRRVLQLRLEREERKNKEKEEKKKREKEDDMRRQQQKKDMEKKKKEEEDERKKSKEKEERQKKEEEERKKRKERDEKKKREEEEKRRKKEREERDKKRKEEEEKKKQKEKNLKEEEEKKKQKEKNLKEEEKTKKKKMEEGCEIDLEKTESSGPIETFFRELSGMCQGKLSMRHETLKDKTHTISIHFTNIPRLFLSAKSSPNKTKEEALAQSLDVLMTRFTDLEIVPKELRKVEFNTALPVILAAFLKNHFQELCKYAKSLTGDDKHDEFEIYSIVQSTAFWKKEKSTLDAFIKVQQKEEPTKKPNEEVKRKSERRERSSRGTSQRDRIRSTSPKRRREEGPERHQVHRRSREERYNEERRLMDLTEGSRLAPEEFFGRATPDFQPMNFRNPEQAFIPPNGFVFPEWRQSPSPYSNTGIINPEFEGRFEEYRRHLEPERQQQQFYHEHEHFYDRAQMHQEMQFGGEEPRDFGNQYYHVQQQFDGAQYLREPPFDGARFHPERQFEEAHIQRDQQPYKSSGSYEKKSRQSRRRR